MKIQFKNYFTVLGILAVSLSSSAQTAPKKYIDPANMDLSVKPGDDFYQYASGTWIKKNPVPAKETRWGSFNQLRDFNINAVKDVLEKAIEDKKAGPGSVTKRVGDFYAAGMDSLAIEKRGFSPLEQLLKNINNKNQFQHLPFGGKLLMGIIQRKTV